MLPEAEVARFIENDRLLSAKPMGQFYQHTIRNIDSDFKYKNLTLKQLGIPEQEVLHVRGEKEFYIELGSSPNCLTAINGIARDNLSKLTSPLASTLIPNS
jgi:hypothetical protein